MGTPVPCPNCRYPNLGIDIWCERCGTPLEWNGRSSAAASGPPAPPPLPEAPPAPDAEPVMATRNPIYCASCGAAMASEARYCQRCGSAVAGGRPALEASSQRRSRRPRAFSLPKLTMPTIAWPRLRLPKLTLPRPRLPQARLPRVPRIAWVVAAVLAALLIVPLAYVLLPPGRAAASRQAAPTHLPSTNSAGVATTPQAAAIRGVEAKTGLHYSAGKCASNAACLALASQTVGQDAAAVVFSTAGSAGRQCVGYVYRSGGSWQFLDAACGLPGQLSPLVGHDATIHVPGNCANVRDGASLKARVVSCLHDGTTVHIDGGPTYVDGRVWWHEKGGWIAHDFLVGP
jgi:hypothetical protein